MKVKNNLKLLQQNNGGFLRKPNEDENDNGQKNYIRSLNIVRVVCRVHTPYKPPSVSDQ